ncbi:T9SS type B sorting domain-containing protein [Seonamhaeicola marinus]|uniref:T9SS type B sorting domain-containing protein n=1 Tax=Seonamhaeicola marinus TaxID=1912246 RepID=A0A5D0HPK8_9FLAO|nr:T9SS type B sorting domain-containing protein [Seonamhaeicola marinus]TYA72007.1 T9SS type B sorting domain-containing protein [Seonamhaeicola marinus]
MKKTTYVNYSICAILLLLGVQMFAQNYVPFAPRFNQDLKGDIVLIGNNILGPDNNAFNNGSTYNHTVDMRYIDIDSDASTFSSSSADLEIANPNCYQIIHAGLYWSAVNRGTAPIDQVRFRGPSGGYQDVTGTIVFDAGTTSVDGGDSFPYACYADVTSIVTGLTNNLGTYTIANVSSAEGRSQDAGNYTGQSAGWSLFIVYEDPTVPGKSITSFDGFSAISVPGGNPALDIPVSGFRTLPAPQPVRANFAFATLEGDSPILGDGLRLNGLSLSTTDRPVSNFFNSSVTQLSALPVNNRVPNSTNTLGFDTGIMAVPNPGNGVIANDATSATVRLETSGDTFFPYFFALAVDIIEPNIVLTKIVEDTSGSNIGGQTVNLGDELNYIIGFQNTGNDNATNLTIRDVLPVNIVFNYPADIVSLPPGVTIQSYNAATREIIFDVDNSVVEEFDPALEIRFRVEVVSSCSLLDDACANVISNQAFATYTGTLNPTFTISDDPSINNNTGCLLTPAATNFLSDLNCEFREEVILCGDTVELTAGSGYDSYSWSSDPSGTPVIGTGQTLTVNAIGTYYVHNTAIAPCQSIDQIFDVITYGAGVPNPVIPFADQVVTCPNDGKELPNFFLCGGNDTRIIQTGITDTSSMIWERLDESSCSAVINADCANEDASCVWNQVATGPDYTIDSAGQYRLTLNYTGGCFNQYYFNVYENVLVPTVTTTDIICSTPGEITVGGVPSGYEYSIDGVNYQNSNIISVTTGGIYTVYVRQIGVSPNPCIFQVPDVQIRERNFSVSTTINQPLCNGDLGNIILAANDVRPQYFFSIYQGATLVNSVGPISPNNYTFSNLNAGTYTINVSTEDGCTFTDDIEIIEPPLLTATAAVTQPLTCSDGEITVYPQGGTAPYFYFVNSTTVFQTVPTIDVTTGGTFNITVIDSNNCSTSVSIDIDAIPQPDFNILSTDILCADNPNSGAIDINVTNANGNTLRYSIDNGVTYSSSSAFTGLSAGTYEVVIEYTYGTDVCLTTPQSITIDTVDPLDGTATVTTPYTCTSPGEITVSGVTGGTLPYEYSIDGVNYRVSNSFPGLRNGTFTVYIRDANGCIFIIDPVVIDPLNPPSDLDFSHTALTCPTNTATVTLTASGGVAPLEYQIVSPSGAATSYQASNTFAGLSPGTYTFRVRDDYNCEYTESYTIDPLPSISVVGQVTENVSCFGAADGEANFVVSNTTSFTYTINGGTSNTGTSPINLTGLSAGNYTIVITDTVTNCTATETVTVDTPSAALSVSTSTNALTCISGGSVTVTATGGWGNYTYELEQPDTSVLGPQTNNTFSNLTQAGTYTVTVTDANNCVETATFNLTTPTNPTATIDAASDYCYDPVNGATLVVSASGGLPPYEYNINGGAFNTSNTFTGLTPGNYTIVVRDANGCDVTIATQTIEPQLQLDATLIKGLDCSATPDGSISITPNGGTAPYTFEVNYNGGGFTTITGTVSPYTASADGTYEFRVTDSQGCVAQSTVVVNPLTNPTATVTAVNPTCDGDTNGSVQIIPSGGVGPYEFSFNGSGFSTTSLYGTLAAGTYNYQVRDANECVFSGSVTLTAPSALTTSTSATPFSCSVTNISQPSVITVTVPTTGTAPYQYSFNGSGFSATNTFTVNDNGSNQTINYTVRDAQGCTFTDSVTITALAPPTDLTFTASTVTCSATTSNVTAVATGGVGTLTYEIILPAASATSNTTGNFTGLAPDTYVFRVTDANGCYYEESLIIDPVINLGVIGALISDVSCNGGNDGAVTFTVSDFGSTYSYTINGGTTITGQTSSTIALTALTANTYTIVVTDEATNCTDTVAVTVSEPSTPLSFSASSTNVFCTNDESQITVTATGGTPNYRFAAVVSGAPAPLAGAYTSTNTITVDTNSGTDLVWDVYVRDINDCEFMQSVTITSDGLPTLNPIATQCYDGTDFNVTLSGTVSVGTAEYSMGSGYQASPTFTITGPGTYTFTIRDGNGCTATQSLVVEPSLLVSALLTKDLTCSVPMDATIDVTISGGTGTYTSYEVSTDGGTTYNPVLPTPVGASFTYTTSIAGTYQFRITDSNSCQEETNGITVSAPVNPSITSITQIADVLCSGESTAAIDIVYDNTQGVPPFTINVNNDTTSTDYGTQTSGLPAGTYTITLTDGNGCTDTDTITISEPNPISMSHSVTPITCGVGGVSLGEIIINSVSGGTPNYSYHVTGVNGYDVELTNQTGASAVFQVVDFGLYEIIITDANGCTYLEQNILVASPPDDLDIVVTSPPADCSTGGSATVSIGAATTLTGTGPFYFAIYTGPGMVWDGIVGGSAIWQLGTGSPASTTFTNLIPGATYTFIVYDDDTNCYYFEQSTLPVPTNSTLTTSALVSNNITCTGSADGNVSFDINSTYGIGTPVTYEIFESLSLTTTGITGSGTVPANGTLSVTNLGPLPFGDYIVVVTETGSATNAGCSVATTNFQITESAILLTVTADATRNENCNELGIITVTAQHGTGPYEYQAVTSGSGTPATWVSTNSFDLAAGTYDLYVRDAYGCIQFDTETVIRDADPTLAPISQQCFNGTPISVTLSGTVSVGPASYSMGGAFQSSPTFSITTSGTYTFTIQDANGCTATQNLVVEPQLELLATLTKDLDCTVTPDASITFTATGGTGTYTTFEVDYNGGGFVPTGGSPYTATAAGTYQFRVTDSQGCIAVSNIITVDPLVNPTASETHIDVSCNGGNDGSITVTASGGVGPYEYSIDNGATFVTTNVFTGLTAAGSPYNVVVRDSKSCTSVAIPVTIDEPTVVTAGLVLTQGLTCGTSNSTQAAILTATGSNGTPPYMYSFNGGAFTSTNTFTTNTAGLVSVVVRDANGCLSVAATETVPALDPPTDLSFVSTPITCTSTTSTVTLTATNGVAPLSYEILAPASAITSNTTGIFAGLAPDTYVFRVTDANNCYYDEAYTVDPVTNIAVIGNLDNNVNCNGGNDGEVTFTVSGFSTTYSYTINGGTPVTGASASTIPLTGLVANTYTIIVTDDATDCTATVDVIVTEPSLLALTETSNVNANCNIGSQVTVTASGGTAPYTYAFVQDGTTPTAGDYTTSDSRVLDPAVDTDWDVYVLDANGCPFMIDVIIDTDPLPSATVPTFAANQCDLTGPYTFTVTSPTGIAPFDYSIDGGLSYQTSPTFSVVTPGTYTVTIRDGNGCTTNLPTTIDIYTGLDIAAAITTLPSCSNDDGEVTVTGSGGTGTYSYSISPSTGITLTGNTFSGLASGTNYTITLTDITTSCTTDTTVILDAATPVTFTTSVTDVSCTSGNDGTITVNLPASNDNPVYTYEIIAPITVGPQASNIFQGLSADTYTVRVTSGRNCFLTRDVVVGEPALLTVSGSATDYSCTALNVVNTSALTISEVGGTAPFTYSIDGSNYFSSNIFDIIDTGSVQNINIYVRDANNCIASNTVTINPLPTLTAAAVIAATPIDCNNTGTVSISVTGGSGNFSYQMLPSGTPQASNVFNITDPGDYFFQVNDLTTGCTITTAAFTVAPYQTIDAVATTTTDITCLGDNNGTFELNVTGYSGNYTYEVYDSNSGLSVIAATPANTSTNPLTISGLAGGNYYVEVIETDSPFCSVISNTFTIDSPSDPLDVIATETSSVTCDNNIGTITAVATGGWGTYEYELTGAATVAYSTNATFTNLSAGSYTVNVRDAAGCIDSYNITLDLPAPINATAIATPSTLNCFGDDNATITVNTVTGGQGSNYSYTLNMVTPTASASGPQSSNIFTNLGPGTYTVTITDGYNCSFTTPYIVITEPNQIQASLVRASGLTCTTDATLTLSATGGTGIYEYSDSDSFTTILGTFTSSTTFSVTPGDYMYYVRDANGCVSSISNQISVDPLPTLTLDLDTSNASINCAGDTTGVIVATAQGGMGSYVYTLQDTMGNAIPATQNSPGVFTELAQGDYRVYVESGDCVFTSATINITEPSLPLQVNFNTSDVTCSGENNGILEIIATGGTGVVKYAISPQLNQFFDDAIFEDLAPGNYQALVQDELGCFVLFDFTINEPAPVLITIVPNSIVPEVCEGDMDGEFSIDISGGTLPYSVALDDVNGTYTTGGATQTLFDFTNLSGGDHIVYISDAEGCTSEWNITFPESVLLDPQVSIEYCTDVADATSNSVTVSIDASVNPADVDYSLDGVNFQASNVFVDVAPGLNRTITVRHTNGCEQVVVFDVNQYNPLQIALSDGGLNEIEAQATGGSGPYEYAVQRVNEIDFEPYQDTGTFIIYESGEYTVTVTDSNGCVATATRYFEYIDVCIPNYYTPASGTDGWGPGCTSQYQNLTVDIFDRYGRVIATLKVNQKWDGNYNGRPLPSGDYWYVLKLNDPRDDRNFVGHFTLYR